MSRWIEKHGGAIPEKRDATAKARKTSDGVEQITATTGPANGGETYRRCKPDGSHGAIGGGAGKTERGPAKMRGIPEDE